MAQAENWKTDKYVIKWLTGLSPKTKDNYLKEFEQWLTFANLSPTEQISKRMHNLTSQDLTERTTFENLWRQFKAYLENKGTLKDASIHGRLRTVASFFSRNDLTLNLHKGDWNSCQQQDVILKFNVDLNDIKAMYGHAGLRDKCLLLILAQSGFSEVDIQGLKIEEIQGLYDMPINEHYVIEKPREKTNHIQSTALSYEFLHDLRNLLAEDNNPKKGFIFISQTSQGEIEISKEERKKLSPEQLKKYEEQQAQARAKAKAERVNAIDTRRINEIMKALAEKTFSPDKAKQFHTKALRSFYNSALLRAKTPSETKDLMMGHLRQGARAHYSYDSETIREAYIQAFEYLSINGLQSRQDLKDMKQEFNNLIASQAMEINGLKELMCSQGSKLEQLSKALNAILPELEASAIKRAQKAHPELKS